ncbi:unnamed protein product [Acanthoscelides obtectus]|uniref:Brain tumor protein n=1 Tax=Acanthoscelides obtectus TaxID=200917 RepID=A0A9P0KRX4_ACAOB|nr:unnamed protein product [Acanthoscelides obtectus]CAK1678342.1 B-box type zinc finger protein ncl-1 [Acanthoscelides obtectus]
MSTNGKEGDFTEAKDFIPKSEEFDELSGIMFEGSDKMGINKSLEDALLADPDNCGMCGELLVVPRMLHCLHVFCEECLDKKLVGEAGDTGTLDASICCPTCNYVTKVGTKKLSVLPLDVTKTNISDVSNSASLHCTSCTAKEVAKSRCSTCHNLLCNNCDTAHHFMRCFESHKVVALDDMRKDGTRITVHKPLVCDVHPEENVIYNCTTCNVTACAECSKNEHKGHPCESILDSEVRVRQEMEALLCKSKERIEQLIKASTGLNNNMEELAHQRSAARDLINESYQSYKAVLERCKEDALEELNRLYHERELKIMKESDELGKTIDNFEDACRYTTRLLENATVPEMMYLRKIVASRLLMLNQKVPNTEKFFSIEFKSDYSRFEQIVKEQFGKFTTESDSAPIAVTTNSNSVVTDLVPLTSRLNMNGVSTSAPAIITNGCSGPVSNTSPISLQSFDGDMGNNHLPNFTMGHSPPLPHVNNTAIQGFNSIAEYNLAQLATLAETTNSAAASPSPTPFTLADILTNDTAYKNLASLAKLGLTGTGAPPTPGSAAAVAAAAAAASNAPVPRTNKVSPMQIRCKFGQLGPSKGQFNSPHGFCLGLEEDIIVADTNNHRIQVFEKTGTFKFQFGIPGKEEGQLWYPRKVAVMRTTGKYVVCDRGNERSRMQIFTKNGHFLKKIAIRYIDIVAGLAVTSRGEIVAVDSVSPTLFIIAESGELLRWIDCSDYMREPSDIAINGKEFYVCDFKGHNVVVFSEEGQYLRRIGCETLTNFPNGIDISDAGDILIGDSHGNRFHVTVFARDGSLISEFECPYVKVSRCCGLKITSEGYVVTLAKNNHHVLVLNTLYIL